jgi:hypothetical protein
MDEVINVVLVKISRLSYSLNRLQCVLSEVSSESNDWLISSEHIKNKIFKFTKYICMKFGLLHPTSRSGFHSPVRPTVDNRSGGTWQSGLVIRYFICIVWESIVMKNVFRYCGGFTRFKHP